MENTSIEYRFVRNSELRTAGAGRIEGYAAVFGMPSVPLGPTGFVERIRAGAFAGSLDGDVVALYNHDVANVLGRTTSGTMQLQEDSMGLKTEIHLPSTQLGRDTYELVKRGDLRGMSFGFNVLRDSWNANHTERELLAIDLHEVSIVARPAYEQTTIQARSLGLPVDGVVLTYAGVPVVTDGEREKLRLRLELLRRLD
jgi:Escherichia/Staphylococcus phage prohead protease